MRMFRVGLYKIVILRPVNVVAVGKRPLAPYWPQLSLSSTLSLLAYTATLHLFRNRQPPSCITDAKALSPKSILPRQTVSYWPVATGRHARSPWLLAQPSVVLSWFKEQSRSCDVWRVSFPPVKSGVGRRGGRCIVQRECQTRAVLGCRIIAYCAWLYRRADLQTTVYYLCHACYMYSLGTLGDWSGPNILTLTSLSWLPFMLFPDFLQTSIWQVHQTCTCFPASDQPHISGTLTHF